MSDAKADASTGASCTVEKARGIESVMRHIGKIDWELIREGEVVQSGTCFNNITNQGVAYMLNRAFFGSTAAPFAVTNDLSSDGSGWYVGLIDTAPTLANTDVATSHAGWAEETTVYDETTKPQYDSELTELETRASQTISTARQISNSGSPVSISITGGSPTPVGGVFLVNVSNATYAAATTILFSTATFGTEPSVQSGDTLQITYTHTISG